MKSVDLHAPPEEEPPQPDCAGDSLCEAYLASRRSRQPINLSAPDKAVLSKVTMVFDSEYTHARVHPVAGPRKYPTADAAADAKGRLRIAAIGYRVKIGKLVGRPGVKDEDLIGFVGPRGNLKGLPDSEELHQLGRTLGVSKEKDSWTSTICKQIRRAVGRGSHLIVLPEFALPPARKDFDIEDQIRKCATDVEGASSDCFIFAGTRHEGSYNKGLLLHKKDGKFPRRDQWHYKIASARSMGENILGPRSHQMISYRVPLVINDTKHPFHVVVAICYDTFDPSTFLRLVQLSARHETQGQDRIIIVPSFNSGTRFVEMLRDLSFLARCPVVYVNGLHGDVRMFIGGIAVRNILNQVDKIKEQVAEQLAAKQAALEAIQNIPNDGLSGDASGPDENALVESIAALQSLKRELQRMDGIGSFKDIISIEGCPKCEAQTHSDDYDCLSDIVYYNLDLGIIRHLVEFRTNYFGREEKFLPESLRWAALHDGALEMAS